MQGYEVTQNSAAYPLVFLLISSTDHITGLTGATVTVTISKNGGAFASPAGAVTEIANGWYKVAGNATDTNTLGPLALHATATGADPSDVMYPVVAVNPQLAATYGLTNLDATVSSRVASASYTTPPTVAEIATAVWQDTTAGDFTVAGSIGKALYINAAPGAAGGHFIAGSNAATTVNITGNLSGSVGSVTGAVTVNLAQTLNAARALDAIADTSLTLNDAFHCAIAGAAGKEDASSGTSLVLKTPSTGTVLRTSTITTSATNPFGSNYPVSRA